MSDDVVNPAPARDVAPVRTLPDGDGFLNDPRQASEYVAGRNARRLCRCCGTGTLRWEARSEAPVLVCSVGCDG